MNLLLNVETPQILTVIGVGCLSLALLRFFVIDRQRWGATLILWLRRLEIALLTSLLGAMIVCSALQIVLRNVMGAGLLWIDPFLRYSTLWIGFLGAAFATAAGRHIQIDILARISPAPVRAVSGRIVAGTASVVTLILAETAYRHVVEEYRFAATGVLDLPTWVLLIVIPFAFALMCYRFVYQILVPPPDREQEGESDAGDASGPGGGTNGGSDDGSQREPLSGTAAPEAAP